MPSYALRVNGRRVSVEASASRSLLSVLREELGLTGAKYGCGEGQCGSCAVLLDGRPALSCTVAVSAVGSRSVVTIEGLARGERLHPVQQAFLDASAFQCGYCTPGMILAGAALIQRNPSPSEADVKTALERHICRCGSYPRIVQAVRMAAEAARRG